MPATVQIDDLISTSDFQNKTGLRGSDFPSREDMVGADIGSTAFVRCSSVYDSGPSAKMIYRVSDGTASGTDADQILTGTIQFANGKMGTLELRDREISAAAFGVRADGTTDDRAALQAAVDFVSAAGGGTVLIPYNTSLGSTVSVSGANRAIRVKNNVVLKGEHKKATVKILPSFGTGAPFRRDEDVDWCAFEDFVIDANNIDVNTQMIDLGETCRGALVDGIEWINGASRQLVRANWSPSANGVANLGNVTVRNCRVEHASAPVNLLAFYNNDPASTGIPENIKVQDNIVMGGGSICHFVAEGNQFDRFKNVEFSGNRIKGNGSGTYGPIPLEAWGVTDMVCTGNHFDEGTRGAGFGRAKNVSCTGNTFRRQSAYACEIGAVSGLVFSNNVVENCNTMVHATNVATDVLVQGNVHRGTMFTSYTSGQSRQAVRAVEGYAHKRWTVKDNKFFDLRFADGITNLRGNSSALIEDMIVEGNEYHTSDPDATVGAATTLFGCSAFARNFQIRNNKVVHRRELTNTDAIAFAIPTTAVPGAGPYVIEGNYIEYQSVSGTGNKTGIGAFTGAVTVPGLIVRNNKLKGNFTNTFNINVSSGDTVFVDNDVSEVISGTASLNAAIVQQRTRRWATLSDVPTTGTWDQGDIVTDTNPAAGGVPGWVCTTGGTLTTVALTGDSTSGSNLVTAISSTATLHVGMYVTHPGFSGTRRITEIVSTTSIRLNANATSNQTGAALTNSAAVFKAMAALAA